MKRLIPTGIGAWGMFDGLLCTICIYRKCLAASVVLCEFSALFEIDHISNHEVINTHTEEILAPGRGRSMRISYNNIMCYSTSTKTADA